MENIQRYVKVFETYLHSLNKSPHTVKQYTMDAKQFAEIIQNEATIKNALQLYSKTIREKYSVSSSINRKFASIRNFLEFLQLRGVIEVFNLGELQPLPKEQMVIPLLNKNATKKVLTFWMHQFDIAQNQEHQWLALRNAAIIFVIAELGVKPSELVKMQWKHWNVDTNELVILSSKKYRTLKISSNLSKLLERYKQGTQEFFSFIEHSPFVWLGVGNKQGAPITVKTIERIFLAMSRELQFKVTATNLRYDAIQMKSQQTKEIEILVEQFGYARKGVLTERQQRFKEY